MQSIALSAHDGMAGQRRITHTPDANQLEFRRGSSALGFARDYPRHTVSSRFVFIYNSTVVGGGMTAFFSPEHLPVPTC